MPAGPVGLPVWATGVWADTVWEEGVWAEDVGGPDPDPWTYVGGRKKKK